MINFEALPQDKPNQSNVKDGRYTASIFDAKMQVSKTTNNEYLNVSFKTSDGFVNENYFESDKPFLLWKLNRLLKACGVKLSGEGTLKDIAKVIKGKNVIIDVAVNDRGYGSLDYSNGKEGIYAPGEIDSTQSNETVEVPDVALDPEIGQAIEATVDEDF